MTKSNQHSIRAMLRSSKKLIHKGGNSKVYQSRHGTKLIIIKEYSKENTNWQERMTREVRTMKLLKDNNFKNYPELVDYDIKRGIIISNYIDGESLNSVSITESICEQIIKNIRDMSYANLIKKDNILFASNSFINPENFFVRIMEQIRYETIRIIEAKNGDHMTNERLLRLLRRLKTDLTTSIEIYNRQMGFNSNDLCSDSRIMSFSDVGSHNCLLKNGVVHYIDFEHSGWDDPAKAYCDWIMRPYDGLNSKESIKMISKLKKYEKKATTMVKKIEHLMPIINIQWAMIRINYKRKVGEMIKAEDLENIYLTNKNKCRNIFSSLHNASK